MTQGLELHCKPKAVPATMVPVPPSPFASWASAALSSMLTGQPTPLLPTLLAE